MLATFNIRKREIQNRIREFKENMSSSEERIFAELCFCICTPQSRATACWEAISTLSDNGLLYYGLEQEIAPFLRSVRYRRKKSGYIVAARDFFSSEGRLAIKERLKTPKRIPELREWLAREVKGLGPKEASHFLRNIGLGLELAILDRHILKNLKKQEVIPDIPARLTKTEYEKIEGKMRSFAEKIGISMAELDLLFWSMETGIVFK